MSSPRFQIPREPGSLKDAEAALVKACGGLIRAAALTRVRKAQLHRYTDPSEPECHMPADVVVALELASGQPIVTQFLALQSAGVFMPLPKVGPEKKTYMAHLGAIGKDTGQFYAEACEALQDGSLSKKERAKVKAEAIKTIKALTEFLGDLEFRSAP